MKKIVTITVLLVCLLGLVASTGYGQNRRSDRKERIRSCNIDYHAAMAHAKSLRGRARKLAQDQARREHDRCLRAAGR